jgi:hypothetical protein
VAVFAVINPAVYFAGYDATGDLRKIAGQVHANPLDTTTFGSGGWHTRIVGLFDSDLTAEGLTDYASAAEENNLLQAPFMGPGTIGPQVVTIQPQTPGDGNTAHLFQALQGNYTQPETVGTVSAFQVGFKGHCQYVRGIALTSKVTQNTNATGTVNNYGAIGATQKLFSTLHVFSVAGTGGPTITTTIQSATNVGMAGATTRVTFTTVSATGAQWGTPVAGAVTDTFWRAKFAITGTNPVFAVAVGIGIQ